MPYLSLADAVARLGEDGERKLRRARHDKLITLYGRRRTKDGLEIEDTPIPDPILPNFEPDDRLRFDLATNSLEVNAATSTFADFDQLVTKDYGWERVQVASREIDALVKSLNGRKGSTANAETACFRWLCAKMAANPDCPDSKESCYAEAQDEFDIGVRAFDRVWRQAINETDAAAWSRPGPRGRRKDRA